MPEPMLSPASQFFIPAMRGGRIAIAAAQTITKKVTKGLAARKAAKIAAKKAAEARARAQQRAKAEREERRKLLDQNKKKAGTSNLDKVNKDLKDADNDQNKKVLKNLLGQGAKYASAAGQETRKSIDKTTREENKKVMKHRTSNAK